MHFTGRIPLCCTYCGSLLLIQKIMGGVMRLLSILLLVVLTSSPKSSWAQSENCDGRAVSDMRSAYAFVASRSDKIWRAWRDKQVPQLTGNMRQTVQVHMGTYRNRFNGAWNEQRFNVVCIDEDPDCKTILGRAPSPRNRTERYYPRIEVCYDHHVASQSTLCDLVDTLVHEAAHQVGVPSSPDHDNAKAS